MIKKKTIRIVSSLFLIAALCVGCPQPNGGDGNEPKNTVDKVLDENSVISSDYIDKNNQIANKYINVSNSIIVYDLIKKEEGALNEKN